MSDTAWRDLRRSLLFCGPAGFLFTCVTVLLELESLQRIAFGDLPQEGSASYVKADMCTPGVKARLATFGGDMSLDVIMAAALVLAFILALIELKKAPHGLLRVVAQIACILAFIALIWVGMDMFICLRDGYVWFAPHCGGAA